MNAETIIQKRYLIEDKLVELLDSLFTDWRMSVMKILHMNMTSFAKPFKQKTDNEIKIFADRKLTDVRESGLKSEQRLTLVETEIASVTHHPD
jgi:hypothetical protein